MYKHLRAVAAVVMVLLAALGSSLTVYAAQISSPMIQSIPEKDAEGEAVNTQRIEKRDTLMAESEELELYLNKSDFVMKILDKRTGYIWSTSVPSDKMEGMNTEWMRMTQSFLTMDFIKSNGTVQRCPMKHGSAKSPVITETENGFDAKVFFKEAKASLTVQVRLEGGEVTVAIPDESIEIDEAYKVNKIYMCPFLGASYKDTNPGYLFVPDGSGALMRFQESRPYSTVYEQRIFGKDRAESETSKAAGQKNASETEQIYIPVFGSVHGVNQNGFAGIITGGAEYCEIQASPAGAIIDYFWEAPAFIYHSIYWQKTGTSSGFEAAQAETNPVNAEVTYCFLANEDADYVGIANAYKEKLLESNPGLRKNDTEGHIGLKLDALMAETKKGLFGNVLQVMTKISDVQDWQKALADNGMENLSVSLTGFEKGGLSGFRQGSYSLDRKIGNAGEMEALNESLNGHLFLQIDITSGYLEQFKTEELKTGMDGDVIEKSEDKELYTDRVYARESTIRQAADSYLTKSPVNNFALEGLADQFISDYNRKGTDNRQEVIEQNLSILRKFEEEGNLSITSPNFNIFETVAPESVYNIPENHSGYIYFTDTVPVLQIVLSGYVEYYGEYQNFAANTVDEVLKQIDFGSWPAYLMTEKEPVELSGTNSGDIYTSQFDTWLPYMEENYQMADEILSQVKGASIVGRTVVETGICKTQYDNGRTVYVNYTDQNVAIDGITLAAKSAEVR